MRYNTAVTVSFVIPGQPIPQPRARVVRAGPGVRSYTPDNGIVAFRQAAQLMARAAGVRLEPKGVPVGLEITFVIERPPSHYTSKGQLTKAAPHVVVTADIDNLQKGLQDALNGIAYVDDRQVSQTFITKRYARQGEHPRTIVTVTTLNTEDHSDGQHAHGRAGVGDFRAVGWRCEPIGNR